MTFHLQELYSSFTATLLSANNLKVERFGSWLFKTGMGYNDPCKWWGNRGKRPAPHEGLDLRFYTNNLGREKHLPPRALIPSVLPGKVVGILDDLVARTLIVKHSHHDGPDYSMYTFYAHINVNDSVRIGTDVTDKSVVGCIAEPKNASACPPHLHLSAAWIKRGTPPEKLSWNYFLNTPHIRSFNPLLLLSP